VIGAQKEWRKMLYITRRIDADRTILTLSGCFNFSAGETFQRAIHQARASETPHLILNLAQVSLLDSAGIGWLMVMHHQLQLSHHHLILVVPPGSLWTLLKLVKLDNIMPIVTREEEVPVLSACVSAVM